MDNSKTVALVSGGFDPIHAGHIDLIQAAAKGNDRLVVGLNSDEWLIRKKGAFFMPWYERLLILSNMIDVNDVIQFNDDDNSANDAIARTLDMYPNHIVNFYNGGDRNESNILELLKYEGNPRVQFYFGCGGDYKRASSSDLLHDWVMKKQDTKARIWGIYSVLDHVPGTKIKTLVVQPGRSLSMQKHTYRSEHWFVAEGVATLEMHEDHPDLGRPIIKDIHKHEMVTIPVGYWHKLSNRTNENVYIVEIQYGEMCEESDITRLD